MTDDVAVEPGTPDTPRAAPPPGEQPMSADRLNRFEHEVGELKVSGGAANPERLGGRWGIALMIVGLVGSILCWYEAYTATAFEIIQRMIILGAVFVGVGIVGSVVWVRNSLTRYLRYWLIRIIYEQREQTEQLVTEQHDQMERLIQVIRDK